MSTNTNIYVDQGIDFEIEIEVFSNETTEVNIDDQTFTCRAKKMYSSGTPIDIETSVNTSDGNPNNLTLLIRGSSTRNLTPGKYNYDLVMDNGQIKSKLLEGLMILSPTISI